MANIRFNYSTKQFRGKLQVCTLALITYLYYLNSIHGYKQFTLFIEKKGSSK